MGERYTRLFSLPGNQYTKGSPLLIAAGALLKDNQTGKVLVQLKFRSISDIKIKAIKVAIAAYDISGNALTGVEDYQYLDLNICRNEEFGHRQAVALPNAVTRSVVVNCTDVVFEDGTVWHAEANAEWKAISAQQTLAENFGELAEQYCRDTSHLSQFALLECEDLWLCTCGAINHNSEPRCHQCNYEKSELLAASEPEGLRQRKSDYDKELAEKAEIKAREAAKKAEQKAAESKVLHAKIQKFGIILGAIAVVCVVALLLVTKVGIPNSQYNDALALMVAGKYDEAIIAFEALNGFKDSENKISECNTAILDNKYNDALALMNAGKYEEAIAAFKALDGYKDSAKKANECNTAIFDVDYNAALALMDAGKFEEAILAFEKISWHRDSADRINECKNAILKGEYDAALKLLAKGAVLEAAIAFAKLGDYEDAQARSLELWAKNTYHQTVAFGSSHIIAIKEDGTVVAAGDNSYGQCNVSHWHNVIAVAASEAVSLGLKADGTVYVAGSYEYHSNLNLSEVSSWRDIVAISISVGIVGIKSDGTVVTTTDIEDSDDIAKWRNIIAVDTDWNHTIGLTLDGNVVGAGHYKDGQINVSDWRNVVGIATGENYSVGLKSDGTVYATGQNRFGERNVSSWKNIVAISANSCATVGLKSDGTVIATGQNTEGMLNVQDWKDIAAVVSGAFYTAAITTDGTLIVIGDNDDGVCNASGWTGIKLPN